jgi:phosphoribosylformylglycinamidine cyclo-ligase
MTTYKDSGVNISAANELVENHIKPVASLTKFAGVLGNVGGFGSVFDLKSISFMNDPLMVTTTDGVGTKLLLAIESNCYTTIGQDLVAMCVNDLIAVGATPTLFLDYYATGKLEVDIAGEIIRSIGRACIQSGCALVGGETAEMPGMYKPGDIDLAGFSIGFVERENLLPKTLSAGDTIIGLSSNGVHSNGFSLVRKILKLNKLKLTDEAPWSLNKKCMVSESLLKPTEIYVNRVLTLQKTGVLKAIAHITGGGIISNLERVIDDNHRAIIDDIWTIPSIFSWLMIQGEVSEETMLETFNCGIGMILIVNDPDVAMNILTINGDKAKVIGKIVDRKTDDEPKVELNNFVGSFL